MNKSDVSPLCRICNAGEETVFSDGVQRQIVQVGHWDFYKKHGVKVQSKENVEETDHVKILWE